MAIHAFTGLPGSGKSYGVFQNVIIPALKKGKVLYTNIPFNEEAVAAACGKVPIPFHVDDINKNPDWFQQVFQAGAVLVIDEVWRLWPSGMKASVIKEQHKSFLAEHRHMVGEDGYSTEIYLVTQDLGQLAIFARDLVESTYRAVKLTNIGAAKRLRVDIYDGPLKGPKPPKDKLLRQIFGKYEPVVYNLYKSHTKSESGAAGDETPTHKRKNLLRGAGVKMILGAIVAAVIVAVLGMRVFAKFYETGGKADSVQSSPAAGGKAAKQSQPPRVPGFLDDKEIRISFNRTGNGESEFTYKVFSGGSYSYVGEYELRRFKYDVQVVNECLVVIAGHGRQHIAQCYREPEKEGLNLVGAGTGAI